MPVTNYVTVNGMLIGERTDSGNRIDYVPDALGSIVAAVDQNMNTTYTAAYKPYGDVLASTGTAPRFTWVGGLGYLASAGVAYAEYSARARIPSSKTGKWTSLDPLWPGQPGYAYASNNPITVSDPSGLLVWPISCCGQERPSFSQSASSFKSIGQGGTNIWSYINWLVRAAGPNDGWGAIEATWEEKSNYPPVWYNAPPDQWINVATIPDASTPFPTLGADQSERAKSTCPKNSTFECDSTSTDFDDPTYNYGSAKPLVKCLCFRISIYSKCKPQVSVHPSSQTVSFQGNPATTPPVVHFPSDSLTDQYCSGAIPHCPQTSR